MRNYLRVRGEYRSRSSGVRSRPELPPRARRIRPFFGLANRGMGTTSACAENTFRQQRHQAKSWNYLRVRGEYMRSLLRNFRSVELPPRARRILTVRSTLFWLCGTTSACAENTTALSEGEHRIGNYLRVRGEYQLAAGSSIRLEELPPRARRIHTAGIRTTRTRGTTSACAENTCYCPG